VQIVAVVLSHTHHLALLWCCLLLDAAVRQPEKMVRMRKHLATVWSRLYFSDGTYIHGHTVRNKVRMTSDLFTKNLWQPVQQQLKGSTHVDTFKSRFGSGKQLSRAQQLEQQRQSRTSRG